MSFAVFGVRFYTENLVEERSQVLNINIMAFIESVNDILGADTLHFHKHTLFTEQICIFAV